VITSGIGLLRPGVCPLCAGANRPVGESDLSARLEANDNSAVGTLPAGTITMLFSDIEGSTALLGRVGDRYGVALSAHRVLPSQH
jgi:class 3 adenylate cyclase